MRRGGDRAGVPGAMACRNHGRDTLRAFPRGAGQARRIAAPTQRVRTRRAARGPSRYAPERSEGGHYQHVLSFMLSARSSLTTLPITCRSHIINLLQRFHVSDYVQPIGYTVYI